MSDTGQSYKGFQLYDILTKLIPGALIVAQVLVIFPSQSILIDWVGSSGLIGVTSLIPIAYITGTIIQGISGSSFPRSQLFQHNMQKVRINSRIEDFDEYKNRDELSMSDNISSSGGEHIDREVWIDILQRFRMPGTFLYKTSKTESKKEEGKPIVYQILFLPLLATLSALFGLKDGKSCDIEYGGEQRGFRIAKAYLQHNDIGEIHRFSSIYVMHRNLVTMVCLTFYLSGFSAVAVYFDVYEPLYDSFIGLATLSITSFLLTPRLFQGMRKYDHIRDREIIYEYYTNVIGGSDDEERGRGN